MKKFLALLLLLPILNTQIFANTENVSGGITYKKARAMSSKSAKLMTQVYEIFDEKGCPMPFSSRSKVSSLLDNIINSSKSRQYDKAVAWNTYGYLYICYEELESSIMSYEKVVNNTMVTYPLRNAALKTLALLHLTVEEDSSSPDITKSEYYWDLYFKASPVVTNSDFAFQAKMYMLSNDYKNAYEAIIKAIAFNELELIETNKDWDDIYQMSSMNYLKPLCINLGNINEIDVDNCIQTVKENDLNLAKDTMKSMISNAEQLALLESQNSSDKKDVCFLCDILKEAIIQYPEAKARADREAAIRRKAYMEGQRKGRAQCSGNNKC